VRYYRAQDTFVGDLDDGTMMRVVKGDVLPESNDLVVRDAAGGRARILFRPLDDAGDEAAARPRSRTARAGKQAAPAVSGKES